MLSAILADSLKILVKLQYLIAVHRLLEQRAHTALQGHIEYLATFLAEEMCMFGCVFVETSITLINSEHLYHSMFYKELECVINGSARQRGELGMQRSIDLVHAGMVVMLYHVFHHRHTLD